MPRMPKEEGSFDVQPLEKAINDSAARVSTIWVTYLLFGLYLAATVGNVTARQLLVAAPIRLPVLNIDLPLIGSLCSGVTIIHCVARICAVTDRVTRSHRGCLRPSCRSQISS